MIIALLALAWLFPLLWALVNSFREYDYTQANGYLSLGGWTTRNYEQAWAQGDFGLHMRNSLLITVPAVLLTLWLSSMVAFVLARFSYRFNLPMLGVFLAANLLPPQALLIPVFRMFREIPLPLFMSDSGSLLNSFWALILVNTAFQMGFCTFVLSNYMKTLPHEIYESAELDGASVWRQYWQLTMPLVRPALAALATLQVTWIYNEFFWATVLHPAGRQAADDLGAQQPARPVLHRHQPASRPARSSWRCRCSWCSSRCRSSSSPGSRWARRRADPGAGAHRPDHVQALVEDDEVGAAAGLERADVVQPPRPGRGGAGRVDDVEQRQARGAYGEADRRVHGEGGAGDRAGPLRRRPAVPRRRAPRSPSGRAGSRRPERPRRPSRR